MKKMTLFFAVIIATFTSQFLYAQIYAGVGAGYIQPFSDFEQINKPSVSYIANIENRYYCKLWYGIKFDYSQFEPADAINPQLPYYNDILNITPQIRYNFLGLNCYDNVVFPYLQLGLSISSAGMTDDSARLGLGALGGGGVSYGFSLFNTCMLLDANASYNLPNVILKDEIRPEIQYLHVNLILNVKL